jgi:hypothetical protein
MRRRETSNSYLRRFMPRPYLGSELGLVGLWRLDEAKFTQDTIVRDSSGNGLDGKVIVTPEKEGEFVIPRLFSRTVHNLQGETAIKVESSAKMNCKELVLEVWACWPPHTPLPASACQVLAERRDGKDCWLFWINDKAQLEFRWWDDAENEEKVASFSLIDRLQNGVWYHLAVIYYNHCYDNRPPDYDFSSYSTVRLYATPAGFRSPQLVGNRSKFRTTLAEGKSNLWIGRSSAGSNYFKGYLMEAALFNYAKCSTEFTTLGLNSPADVRVTGDFENGSCLGVIETDENRISCRANTGNTGLNYWFHARLDNCQGKTLTFRIEIPVMGGTMLNAAFFSYDKKKWERIPDTTFIRGTTIPGSLTFTHKFLKSPAWIASFVPFTLTDLNNLLDQISPDPLVSIKTISHSVEGRPIKLILVTEPSSPWKGRKVVWMQGGQHAAGEMFGGRITEGAIRYLLSEEVRSSGLLKNFIFLFVPIVNVDGTFHGWAAYNKNLVNLNREWANPTEPEIKGMKEFMDEWYQSGRRIDLFLDFHGGGFLTHNATLLRKSQADSIHPTYYSRQTAFMKLAEECAYNRMSDWGECEVPPYFSQYAMAKQFGSLSFSPEVSNMCYYRKEDDTLQPVTQKHLAEMGAGYITAAVRLLRQVNEGDI